MCDVLAEAHHAEVCSVCKWNFCLDYIIKVFISSYLSTWRLQPSLQKNIKNKKKKPQFPFNNFLDLYSHMIQGTWLDCYSELLLYPWVWWAGLDHGSPSSLHMTQSWLGMATDQLSCCLHVNPAMQPRGVMGNNYHYIVYHTPMIFICVSVYCVNPDLPDPVNFIPFGTMKYSIFDINLISHEPNLHIIC